MPALVKVSAAYYFCIKAMFTYVILAYAIIEVFVVEIAESVVNEWEQGSTRIESESVDETFTRLESSGKTHIELFSILAWKFGSIEQSLVASTSIDKIEETH